MGFLCFGNQPPSRTALSARARKRTARIPSLFTGQLHILFNPLTIRTGTCYKRRRATIEETYIFEKLVKRGEFSELWVARSRSKHKVEPVLLKLMSKGLYLASVIVNEMAALRILNNWGFIVQMETCFQTETQYAIVLKFATRGTLHDRVRMVRCFSELVTRFYAAGIAEGLFTLHHRGIIHRNLNLDNILICENGHVVLSDFSSCFISDVPWHEMDREITPWEEAHKVPFLPAPELFLGMSYDKTVDWWSFGIIVYRMICGEYPFSSLKQKPKSETMADVTKVYTAEVYPNFMSLPAQQLISQLLSRRPISRLGSGRFEENAVTGSPFFYHVEWTELRDDTLPAPFSDLANPTYHRSQASWMLPLSYMGTLANPKLAAGNTLGERMSLTLTPASRSFLHIHRHSDILRSGAGPAQGNKWLNLVKRAVPR